MIVYLLAALAALLAIVGMTLIFVPAGILTAALIVGATAWFVERELERGTK